MYNLDLVLGLDGEMIIMLLWKAMYPSFKPRSKREIFSQVLEDFHMLKLNTVIIYSVQKP